MANNDRSVGLSDLASRARSSPQGRQRTSTCINPECRDGMTPGAVASGGGAKGAPLFGAGGVGASKLLRWGWVQCLACNPSADARKVGARYKDLNLSDGEIARRAELANSKATYQAPVQNSLSRPAGSRPVMSPPTAPGADAGKLAELLEQNKQLNERLSEVIKQNAAMTETLSRMSMQVASLLEDNAKLRAAQPGPVYQAAVEAIQRTSGTLTLPEKKL